MTDKVSPYDEVVAIKISEQGLPPDLGGVLRRVENGEAFVITSGGVPMANLNPP
ncbi:MAG: hypothetical protein ACRDHX_09565 [Chloroflexota bacterium]